jgi:ketosteroid isomerase-like protein
MSQANVERIQSLYDALARGDIETVLGALATDVVWHEAENLAYADRNPYVGPQAVVEGVFARLDADWDPFAVVIDAVHDAGDTVVVQSRYKGVCKATGKPIDAQAVHVWTLGNGKVTAFQQYIDTLQVARAMA